MRDVTEKFALMPQDTDHILYVYSTVCEKDFSNFCYNDNNSAFSIQPPIHELLFNMIQQRLFKFSARAINCNDTRALCQILHKQELIDRALIYTGQPHVHCQTVHVATRH